MQRGDVLRNVGIVGGFDRVDESFHEVSGLENRRDQFGTGRDLAVAHAVEDFLQSVSQQPDAVEPQEPRGPLNRVHRAENGVHQVGVDFGAASFNRQHLLFDVGQSLLGFDHELSNQPCVCIVHFVNLVVRFNSILKTRCLTDLRRGIVFVSSCNVSQEDARASRQSNLQGRNKLPETYAFRSRQSQTEIIPNSA